MLENLKKIVLVFLISLLILSAAATAETSRGDLSSRFDNIPQVEYQGKNYSLRNQLTTVLLMGILTDEETGVDEADFIALIVVDDDAQRMTPVQIDADMLVSQMGASQEVPIRTVYASGEDREENCQRLVSTVNEILGENLINYYFAFELKGAASIEGFASVEGDAEAQMRALKTFLEDKSVDELTELNEQLADYIITDMKSGAMVKIMDKSERYERPDMIDLPVLQEPGEGDMVWMRPDADAIFEMVVPLFYVESIW